VKSVAKWLMIHFHITDQWLPFVTGLVFFLPLLLLVFLLERIPLPSETDKQSRVTRLPMDKKSRKHFFSEFSTGLILLIVIYVFLTMFRDIRDNFAADIWLDLGLGSQPSVFTATEIPITILVLVLISSMMLIKNSRHAFVITHYIIVSGFMIAGISSLLFVLHLLAPFAWMTLAGLGLYIGYIPFNCILFDRMIAAFRQSGNVGFLMYVADSFGYLASVSVILVKTFFTTRLSWTIVYSNGVIFFSIIGIVATFIALGYFQKKLAVIPQTDSNE
jgi:hypothetical protein